SIRRTGDGADRILQLVAGTAHPAPEDPGSGTLGTDRTSDDRSTSQPGASNTVQPSDRRPVGTLGGLAGPLYSGTARLGARSAARSDRAEPYARRSRRACDRSALAGIPPGRIAVEKIALDRDRHTGGDLCPERHAHTAVRR